MRACCATGGRRADGVRRSRARFVVGYASPACHLPPHREYRRDAQSHVLRAVDCECWCNREARARPDMRELIVIEIRVRGQLQYTSSSGRFDMGSLPVFYANEENLCYMRRTVSNVNVSARVHVHAYSVSVQVKLDDIARLVRAWIDDAYTEQADTST
jgi:hypothetical protein